VFYLVRREAKRSLGELWAADVVTGRSEPILPGTLMRSYHISPDGALLVFDGLDEAERSRVWVVTLEPLQAPRQLTGDGEADEQRPFFGASGHIYFMQERSRGLFSLYRMNRDGSGRQRISHDVRFLVAISPDEKWAVLWESGPLVSLLPLEGGALVRLCTCGLGPIYSDSPSVAWSGDGQWMYVHDGDGTLSIPWRGADTLRAMKGPSLTDWEKLPGAQLISEISVAPGPTPTTYAFARQSQQSNLYRIQLP
jgi:hypothetical protein